MNHVYFLVAPRIEKSRDFSAHVVSKFKANDSNWWRVWWRVLYAASRSQIIEQHNQSTNGIQCVDEN